MRAIHFGLNKYPAGNALSKCVADARDMAKLFGGKLILDGDATAAAIVDLGTKCIEGAGPGETVVVTYSGHGTQLDDNDGDEPDQVDEAIVGIDLECVRDDIVAIMLAKLHSQARGLLIADSCFSGTIQRAMPSFHPSHTDQLRRRGVRYIAPEFVHQPRRKVANVGPQAGLANWVIISGCADFEVSYEGRRNGVLSGAFKAAYSRTQSIYSIFTRAAKLVSGESWPQHPQITCSAAARKWVFAK